MKKINFDPFLYLIEDFFSPIECDEHIHWSEQKGYEDAKVEIEGKQTVLKEIRNNSRITFIDFDLASKIWGRFKPFAVNKFANSEVIGLNEMFRFYKYNVGQRFKKHIDGNYIRNEEEVSYFTLMIYLNDNFEGGETTFRYNKIVPKKGTALVFYHGMEHTGEEIISGTKYILRTDVMYRIIK